MPKITEVYCWICTEEDGSEGIPAQEMIVKGKSMMMPFLAADLELLKSMEPSIHKMRLKTKIPYKLVKFSHMEIIVELPPL